MIRKMGRGWRLSDRISGLRLRRRSAQERLFLGFFEVKRAAKRSVVVLDLLLQQHDGVD
jgi:hypothetical protein